MHQFIIFAENIPIFYNLQFDSLLKNDEISKNCDVIKPNKNHHWIQREKCYENP